LQHDFVPVLTIIPGEIYYFIINSPLLDQNIDEFDCNSETIDFYAGSKSNEKKTTECPAGNLIKFLD
jgi:hypothetical protein